MLTIRNEQTEAFAKSDEEMLVEEVYSTLRDKYVKEVEQIEDRELHERIRIAFFCAKSYGLQWKSSLSAFALWMILISPNFDEHPRIKRLLEYQDLIPDKRIALVDGLVLPEEWAEAKAFSDESVWQQKRQLMEKQINLKFLD
jgi:hypothetical protein